MQATTTESKPRKKASCVPQLLLDALRFRTGVDHLIEHLERPPLRPFDRHTRENYQGLRRIAVWRLVVMHLGFDPDAIALDGSEALQLFDAPCTTEEADQGKFDDWRKVAGAVGYARLAIQRGELTATPTGADERCWLVDLVVFHAWSVVLPVLREVDRQPSLAAPHGTTSTTGLRVWPWGTYSTRRLEYLVAAAAYCQELVLRTKIPSRELVMAHLVERCPGASDRERAETARIVLPDNLRSGPK